MTVLEVIQRSAVFLDRKGVESPRLQAELLLAHVLQLPRMQLYLNFERILSSTEQDQLRTLVTRRGQREPFQHIVGSTSFCGLEIEVNGNVLVPRPETELLAEHGWTFLRQRQTAAPSISTSNAVESQVQALDFGTGSGCLAVALAVNCPDARIVGLDVSDEALRLAEKNVLRHGLADRIQLRKADGLEAQEPARFDLIIANPPYIPTSEIATLEPEVRDHDPHCALDGGVDGLALFRRLAKTAGLFLKQSGKFMAEFGDGQDHQVAEIFRGENWIVEPILKDYTQKPRILVALPKPSATSS